MTPASAWRARRRASRLLLLLTLSAPDLHASQAPQEVLVRVVVTDTAGVRVPGARVTLVELERHNIGQFEVGRTDASGRLTVRFAKKEEAAFGLDDAPLFHGWGVYRLVVRKNGFGWRVSDLLFLGPSQPAPPRGRDYGDLRNTSEPSAWTIGEMIDLSELSDVTLPLTLDEGTTLRGVVRRPDGAPVPGATVKTFIDLEALSHTGWGGEIAGATASSKADGTFEIPHVGDFLWWVSAHHPKYSHETQTARYCRIPVRVTAERAPALDIVLTDRVYRYYGVVRGRAGVPIAGATVTAAYEHCTHRRSWGFQELKTDARGRYRFVYGYPHVYMLRVSAPGHRPTQRGDGPGDHLPPGRADFELVAE